MTVAGQLKKQNCGREKLKRMITSRIPCTGEINWLADEDLRIVPPAPADCRDLAMLAQGCTAVSCLT